MSLEKITEIKRLMNEYYVDITPEKSICGKVECSGQCCETYVEVRFYEAWLIAQHYRDLDLSVLQKKAQMPGQALLVLVSCHERYLQEQGLSQVSQQEP